MSSVSWVLFLVGAATGAPTRYLVDAAVESRVGTVRPLGTLVVNATGSLIAGVVVGLAREGDLADWAAVAVGTGFCGALTTFSAFTFQVVRLIERGDTAIAASHVALNTTLSIALAAAGYAVAAALG
jgi:CrcB protein